MRLTENKADCVRWRDAGFTLMETMVAILAVGTMFLTLYMAFTQGFAVVQVARENLRATQILQERMETIRLYTWDQLNTSGFVPTSFEAPFYAVGTNTSGLTYKGTLTISPAYMSGSSYSDRLRLVTVTVTWRSGQVDRVREMQTLASRYGLQQYIY